MPSESFDNLRLDLRNCGRINSHSKSNVVKQEHSQTCVLPEPIASYREHASLGGLEAC